MRIHESPQIRLDAVAPAGPRYAFLDGIRGLSAFYVLIHHAAAELDHERLRGFAHDVAIRLRYGHYAVAIFIVLSGFCLALPIADDQRARLRGGTLAYLGRRARRILPPYYAALVFFLAVIAMVPALREPITPRWAAALPATTPDVIVSHLLLVHDFSHAWAGKIDPPMWSIAVEWQIYLLFPLLLIVRRRLGTAAMVVVAVGLGNLDKVVSALAGVEVFNGTCPWYVGLFALGAAAAEAARRPGRSTPWFVAAAAIGAVACSAIEYQGAKVRWNDQLFGLAIACALVAFARAEREAGRRRRWLAAILESPIALGLGTISYSLYLTHFPLLSWIHGALTPLDLGPGARMWILLGAGVPLCLGFAMVFHHLVERPTSSANRPRQLDAPRLVLGASAESAMVVAEASNGAVIGLPASSTPSSRATDFSAASSRA
ncbi:MAG: acyltransferase [Isosphaeraceae bacterium]|nr:acyltransferase [Isosphaeraceae bacterium]